MNKTRVKVASGSSLFHGAADLKCDAQILVLSTAKMFSNKDLAYGRGEMYQAYCHIRKAVTLENQ